MQTPRRYRLILLVLVCVLCGLGLWLALGQATALRAQAPDQPWRQRMLADRQPAQLLEPLSFTPCTNGMAGSYPCQNVDLLAFMPLAQIGGGEANDIWGWTDSKSGREFAIIGRTNGTGFVEVTDPQNPVYMGSLPTHSGNSLWRDIKVYANHAFIVSEASAHGIQVFDLDRLTKVNNPPVTFTEDAHYGGFGSAHNLVINEDSGYAYGVGANCGGGLHMVDIRTPTSPVGAGCFSADGYTHDAQCVNYVGPDPDHQGKEICFNANEDTLTVVDVTNKGAPVQLSRNPYAGWSYAHQGWLTEDQRYFFLDDEGDEASYGHNTRTYVWDVTNLDAPVLVGSHTGSVPAIDHNLYVRDNLMYQANYRAGLRVLEIVNPATATLQEIAFFDVYPSSDSPNFNGAWSVYPYFDSGVVVVSGIEQGLFVLQPPVPVAPVAATLTPDTHLAAGSGSVVVHDFALANVGGMDDVYTLTVSGGVWPTTLLTPTPVAVTAGTAVTLSVAVTAPYGTATGHVFTIAATSSLDPAYQLTSSGTTEVFAVTAGGSAAVAAWGETVTHTVALTNSGSVTDTFTVGIAGNGWTAVSDTPALTLGPGASGSVRVAVTAGSGAADTAVLTFTSGLNPAVYSRVPLTTTTLLTYLPVARKA
ncbi:MAG: choice-of-anchor B family protein [Anaerolineales bacterium]|nr:choice-of-anchor B family protein [Anaerolineales bacterium]